MISKQRLEEIINEYQDSGLSGLADDILAAINESRNILWEGVFETSNCRLVFEAKTDEEEDLFFIEVDDTSEIKDFTVNDLMDGFAARLVKHAILEGKK